jgi:AcrR family transcriptional regulator
VSTRDRILDAAATVMRTHGIARATTKEIARAAGCSEALLYKHFGDKQEIFLGVLSERVPPVARPRELAGTGTVRGNLVTLTAQLMRFYARTFPMAASIFGDAELLRTWRAGLDARGAGPRGPILLVEGYVTAERDAGRVRADADASAVAALLAGAALQRGFLAAFEGAGDVEDAEDRAAVLVDAILPGLSSRP